MTVPELRAECKRRGLPTYQVQGRRLRKADLVRQLKGVNDDARTTGGRTESIDRVVRKRTISDGRRIGRVAFVVDPVPERRAQQVDSDPMLSARAQAERDLDIDWATATKHASALGIPRAELLDEDAATMHRILRGCSRPADDRHWRTKEVIREMVQGAS